MKIQCDVCHSEEAAVFCSADEAALCTACDHRVHHANKLASKHQRFSLLNPSSKQSPPPLCDICQEKRAFLFCQQDRAILCMDCDVPIHGANEHTKIHNRFLLTGVKLAPTADLYKPITADKSLTNGCDSSIPEHRSQPVNVSSQIHPTPSIKTTSIASTSVISPLKNDECFTSSISEYLMDTLPGWHVEDLLDSNSASYAFSKNDDGVMMPFMDGEFEGNLSYFSPENVGIWVPQAPSSLITHESQYNSNSYMYGNVEFNQSKETTNANKWWRCDDAFTVPQISPPSTNGAKRSRNF